MGALTSKPFSFAARSWELVDRLAYDCTDTFFSTIKVSFRGKTIMRILPDLTQTALSEWISDRTRFSYDSLQNQTENDNFFGNSYKIFSVGFIKFFSKRFSFNDFYFDYISGCQSKASTEFCGLPAFNFFVNSNFDSRNSYNFDYFSLLETKKFKNYFLLGVNLRYQLPVFAVFFRKISVSPETFFFNFGFYTNNLFNEINFGPSLQLFFSTIRAKSKISRIYFSDSTVLITNPFLYSMVAHNKNHVYSFFDAPDEQISAEIFSSIKLKQSFIKPFLPHFLHSTHVFNRANKLQKFVSPINFQLLPYTNFLFNKKFSEFNINIQNFIAAKFNYFLYNNFNTHFFSLPTSADSLHILLAIKRQTSSRSNFNYYNL